MNTTLPLYARVAAVIGRPVVLLAALAMSAPGEYRLAILAGWSVSVAWLMPVSLSVYAAVAAVIAATRPKGTAGRGSSLIGAGMALSLALAAQVTAHLIASGYMATSAFLVAATSAVPPVVVAHMLHLAAVPKPVSRPDAQEDTEPTNGRESAAERALGPDPVAVADSFWQDFNNTADKTSDATANTPVTLATIRAAMSAMTEEGRKVNGQTLASHLGVSARTGRRYLAMAS